MLNSVISSKEFNNFEITQSIKQQLFIKAPCLNQQPELIGIFEMLLCKREAIKSATVSPSTDSIAIQFDSKKLPLEKLFLLLDTLLANINCNTGHTKKNKTENTKKIDNSSRFLIAGMKCESCAVLLEMALNRSANIKKARVDYESSMVTVYTDLSPQEIIDIIHTIGFEAKMRSFD